MQGNNSLIQTPKSTREYTGPHRNGENGTIPPRGRRFYFNGNSWFFHTRERITFGPYASFREAEENLKLYLRRCGVVRYQLESRPR